MTLDGKKAIVTGAARGLGAAIAGHLADQGCDLELWDIEGDKLTEAAGVLAEASGHKVLTAVVDITDAQAVSQATDAAAEALGGLDVFVANAGMVISGDAIDFNVDMWRKVIDVNLIGYFICAREAARVMVGNGGGSIIQINSKSGKKGSFRNSAYAASKFGGIGVTQSLALEFAERGVRVNSICPGNLLDSPLWVNTLFKDYAKNQGITEEEVRQKYIDQVPMKRPCQYGDVTNVVVFLASEASSYMTGQAINVTGGQSMS
jgi:sorbitol-6-phosphate 2-dehydrogenase